MLLFIWLAEKGYISSDVKYIDDAKMESKADKYTFVRKKSTEKDRIKLLEKIRIRFGQVDDSIARENGKGSALKVLARVTFVA